MAPSSAPAPASTRLDEHQRPPRLRLVPADPLVTFEGDEHLSTYDATLQTGWVELADGPSYPIRRIGVAHRATATAAMHFSADGGSLAVGLAVAAPLPGVRLQLIDATAGRVERQWLADLTPDEPLVDHVSVPHDDLSAFRLTAFAGGAELLTAHLTG
ncbi:hypothetical protein [Kribbella sp. NPDC051770]|uniref:hypothetical protein n=1 Tax=Kribbella sp. NPDC051770 TaxID=3155413 RepID=UPI0034473305